jgi:hypothetical protein
MIEEGDIIQYIGLIDPIGILHTYFAEIISIKRTQYRDDDEITIHWFNRPDWDTTIVTRSSIQHHMDEGELIILKDRLIVHQRDNFKLDFV